VELGNTSFRLDSRLLDGEWLIVGQSLHETAHVQSVLEFLEVLAGPLLLIAMFFGTLLVGLKASGPVEDARRRQLEFTADASHELRTPLSVIEAEVSLALRTNRTETEYRDTLERVGHESLRLRDIVEDLLWLSRFDAEPPPPCEEPVDVFAVAVACADRFGAIAQHADIDIAVRQLSVGQPWINAAPDWVNRLVSVLVDNACRYAGTHGRVSITVDVDAGRVVLVVEDSGPGIPPDERPKLFDRFHRAIDDGTGAGLGLAIADSVVRATGAQWRVGDSALGGARMEVSWHRSSGSKDPGELVEAPAQHDPADTLREDPSVVR
jgi:signal transduction histidine kinase